MPVFELEMPDGRTFEVDAPDQQMALSALNMSAEQPRKQRSMLESAINGIASGLTFGFDDEIAAGLQTGFGTLGDYDRTVAEFRRDKGEMAEDNPITNTVAELAGGIGTGVGLFKSGATLAGKAAGKSLAKRAGMMGAEGAAYGAAAGLGHSEGDLAENAADTALGAVTGFGVGAALPAAGAGARKLLAKKPTLNSIDTLRAIKNAAYDAVDKSGFQYSGKQLGGLVDKIDQSMQVARINPMRHPKAHSMLQDLQALKDKPMSLTELDQLRQVIGSDVAGAVDKSERRLGKIMIKQIDKFIDQQGGGDLVKAARSANSRFAKAQAVDSAVRTAERRAASTGSGGNEDNAIRQNVRRLVEKYEKGGTSFTPEEVKLMERVVRGNWVQNKARNVGKLSPTGNGLMTALNLGATAMEPLMAIPGGVGIVAKAFADSATKRNVRALEEVIRGVATTPAQKSAAGRILQNKTIMTALKNALAAEGAAATAPLELTVTLDDIR